MRPTSWLTTNDRSLLAAAELARAAGCPSRLAMLRHLRCRTPATVGDLQRAVGVSQPTASRHVADMRRAGLIATRRRGPSIECELTAAGAVLVVALDHAVEGLR